jgi:hypothetical protein
MADVKIIVLLSFFHFVSHLCFAVDDSLEKTGPLLSTTSRQVSASLRNLLNQESVERFKMMRRIERLLMDVIEVKSDNLDLHRDLIDVKNTLHRLEAKDQTLEGDNSELKSLYNTQQV